MKGLCSLCGKEPAVLECEEDAARLCGVCDELVHGANKLSNRHTRWPICTYCGILKATRASHHPEERAHIKYACEGCAVQLPAASKPDVMLLGPLPPPQLRSASPQAVTTKRGSGHHASTRSHRHVSTGAVAGGVGGPRHRRAGSTLAGVHALDAPPRPASQPHQLQLDHAPSAQLELSSGAGPAGLELGNDISGPLQDTGAAPSFTALSIPSAFMPQLQSSPAPAVYNRDAASMDGQQLPESDAAAVRWPGDNTLACAQGGASAQALHSQQQQQQQQQMWQKAEARRGGSNRPPDASGWMAGTNAMAACGNRQQVQHGSRSLYSFGQVPDQQEDANSLFGELQQQAASEGMLGAGAAVPDEPELLDNLFSSWTHETSNTPGLFAQAANALEDLWPMDMDEPPEDNPMHVPQAGNSSMAGAGSSSMLSWGAQQQWGGAPYMCKPPGPPEAAAQGGAMPRQGGGAMEDPFPGQLQAQHQMQSSNSAPGIAPGLSAWPGQEPAAEGRDDDDLCAHDGQPFQWPDMPSKARGQQAADQHEAATLGLQRQQQGSRTQQAVTNKGSEQTTGAAGAMFEMSSWPFSQHGAGRAMADTARPAFMAPWAQAEAAVGEGSMLPPIAKGHQQGSAGPAASPAAGGVKQEERPAGHGTPHVAAGGPCAEVQHPQSSVAKQHALSEARPGGMPPAFPTHTAGTMLPPLPTHSSDLDPQQVAMQHMLLMQQQQALMMGMGRGAHQLPAAFHHPALGTTSTHPSSKEAAGPPSALPMQQGERSWHMHQAGVPEPSSKASDSVANRQQQVVAHEHAARHDQQQPAVNTQQLPPQLMQQLQGLGANPFALPHMPGLLPGQWRGSTPDPMSTGMVPDLLHHPGAPGLPHPLALSMLAAMPMHGLHGMLGAFSKPGAPDLPPHLHPMLHPHLAMMAMLNQQAKPGGLVPPWETPMAQHPHASQAMSQEARSTQSIKQQTRLTQPTSSNSQKQHTKPGSGSHTKHAVASSDARQQQESAAQQQAAHPHGDPGQHSAQVTPAPASMQLLQVGSTGAAAPGSSQRGDPSSGGLKSAGHSSGLRGVGSGLHPSSQHVPAMPAPHLHRGTAPGLMLPPLGLPPGMPPGVLNPYFMLGAAGLPPDRLHMMAPWMLSAAAAGAMPPPGLPLSAYLPQPPGSHMAAAGGSAYPAPTVCSVRPSGSTGGDAAGLAAGNVQLRMAGNQPPASHLSPPGLMPFGMAPDQRFRGTSSTGAAMSMGAMGLGMMGSAGMQHESVWSHDQRYSERGQALTRYRQKRKLRHFEKTIRYASRQVRAHKRPRVKGRFIKLPPGATAETPDAACFCDSAPGPLPRNPSTLAVVNMAGEELTENGDVEDEDGDIDMDLPRREGSLARPAGSSAHHPARLPGAMSSTDADADAELSDEGGRRERDRERAAGKSPGGQGMHMRGSGLLLGGPAMLPPVPATASSMLHVHQSSANHPLDPVQPVPSVGIPAPAELQGEQPPRQPTPSKSVTSRASMGSVHRGGAVGRGGAHAAVMPGGHDMALAAGFVMPRGSASGRAGEAAAEALQQATRQVLTAGLVPGLQAAMAPSGAPSLALKAGQLSLRQPIVAPRLINESSSSSSSQNKHTPGRASGSKHLGVAVGGVGAIGGGAGHKAARGPHRKGSGGSKRRGSGGSGPGSGHSSGRQSGGRSKPGGAGHLSSGHAAMPPPLDIRAGMAFPAAGHLEPAKSESAENTPPAAEVEHLDGPVVHDACHVASVPSTASNGVVGRRAAGAGAQEQPAVPIRNPLSPGLMHSPSGALPAAVQHSAGSPRGRGRGRARGPGSAARGLHASVSPHAVWPEARPTPQCAASLGTAVGSHHLTGSCADGADEEMPLVHVRPLSPARAIARGVDDEDDGKPEHSEAEAQGPAHLVVGSDMPEVSVSGASNTLPSMEASTLCPAAGGVVATAADASQAPSTLGTLVVGSKQATVTRSRSTTQCPKASPAGQQLTTHGPKQH